MIVLRRKIYEILKDWKKEKMRKPMIVKGAPRIGKTYSISRFGSENYASSISIDFIRQPEYMGIFRDGFDVDSIVRNISFIDPELRFVEGDTLILFDELQECPSCVNSLKSFAIDGRYDVICSGSLMGISCRDMEANALGYKTDIEMFPLDFEEFLWAKGYDDSMIDSLLHDMLHAQPIGQTEFKIMSDTFEDYMVVGGMPAVVEKYISQGNFSGTLRLQRQILSSCREDISKYAGRTEKPKILNVYDHIPAFLAKDNKRFQISKIRENARNRDYAGAVGWLASAGMVNVCHCIRRLELPLTGNSNPDMYKLYFPDTGLLVAALDEAEQEDLRKNRNFGIHNGALYENAVADMLRKQGYTLLYYRNGKSTFELDFLVRDSLSLIPLKATASDRIPGPLLKVTDGGVPDISYGIRLCGSNVRLNGRIYTFPYFLTFLLRRFLSEKKNLLNGRSPSA